MEALAQSLLQELSDAGMAIDMAIEQLTVVQVAVAAEPKKLWGGRFTGATDPLMEKFNESLPFDRRLSAEDIQVSAHVPYSSLHAISLTVSHSVTCGVPRALM